MATVTAIAFPAEGHSSKQVVIIVWGHLHQGDDGGWVQLPAGLNRSVHVWGTFGGANITFQGSNEVGIPSNPVTLRAPDSTNLNFNGVGLAQVLEAPYQVRPLVQNGDGTTDLFVSMCVVSPIAP